MDNKMNFYKQSMDEIVFYNRNKNYGAYVLRETYQKNLLKAMGISICFFVLGLLAPKLADILGLFKEISLPFYEQVFKFEEVDVIPGIESETIKETVKRPPNTKTADGPLVAVDKTNANEYPAKDPADGTQNKGPETAGPTTPNGNGPSVPAPDTSSETGKPEHYDHQRPYFIGGEDAFKTFLDNILIYPRDESDLGIEGETIVSFVVNIDGRIEDVTIVQSSGNRNLDREAINAVKKASSMFKPGRINGKPVRSVCRIPITFELEDE